MHVQACVLALEFVDQPSDSSGTLYQLSILNIAHGLFSGNVMGDFGCLPLWKTVLNITHIAVYLSQR